MPSFRRLRLGSAFGVKTSPFKKLILVGAALAGLLFAVSVLLICVPGRMPSAKPFNLAVTFLGFTNTPAGATGVAFLFTNGTPRVQQVKLKGLEYQDQVGWHSQPLGRSLFRALGPGYAFSDWFPVSGTNRVWRIRLACREQAMLVDSARARLYKVVNGRDAEFISGRSYQVLASTTGMSTEQVEAPNERQ